MCMRSEAPGHPSRGKRPSGLAACWIASLVGVGLSGNAALAGPGQGPGLGQPLSATDIAAISLNVFPDGSGLPPGHGTVNEGQALYDTRCASCHGSRGLGGSAEELAGGANGLLGDPPDKTIGTYWPYATTLFDYVRRSMPLDAPRSLSDDQVYALTAYLLFLNGITGPGMILDAPTLARIEMPNRNGFIRVQDP